MTLNNLGAFNTEMIPQTKNLPVDTYKFIEETNKDKCKNSETAEGKTGFKILCRSVEFTFYWLRSWKCGLSNFAIYV